MANRILNTAGWDRRAATFQSKLDWDLKTQIDIGTLKTFADGDVNTTTEVISITAHGFTADQQVRLSSTGTLPAGLAAATTYFVQLTDANSFTLSATAGGADVDITAAAGGGTHTIVPVQYDIASTNFLSTAANGKKVRTDALNPGIIGLFANDADAHDALVAMANAEQITLATTFTNSSEAEIGSFVNSGIFIADSGGGANPSLVVYNPVPIHEVTNYAVSLTLTAAIAIALDGTDLFVGWAPF